MQITRETDYAVRCVTYLVLKQGEVVMVDEIANENAIPKSFLSKILQKLVRSGIVKSFRGVKGGFQLAREPQEITLLDVVEATEGPISVNICTHDESRCCRSDFCTVHPVWVEIKKSLEDRLKSQDFSQLAR
ncbi:MAG: Rrf2 family transcriptional regulator [Nitrospirales bacterium]|nr:Rrf2 family transcriptional regulator [Nitrospirales bacterium]